MPNHYTNVLMILDSAEEDLGPLSIRLTGSPAGLQILSRVAELSANRIP